MRAVSICLIALAACGGSPRRSVEIPDDEDERIYPIPDEYRAELGPLRADLDRLLAISGSAPRTTLACQRGGAIARQVRLISRIPPPEDHEGWPAAIRDLTELTEELVRECKVTARSVYIVPLLIEEIASSFNNVLRGLAPDIEPEQVDSDQSARR